MSVLNTEVVVLGCGAVGSATIYELARKNIKVIGIDQYSIAHNKGSSHGETRAMRQGYYDAINYIPILKKAYQQWMSLEDETNNKIFEKVGVIAIMDKDKVTVNNIVDIAGNHNISIEVLYSNEINYRYHGLHAENNMIGILEKDGGYLYIEKIISLHLEKSMQKGARILTEEKVVKWRASESVVIVETDKHTIRAEKLIICAGGWTNQFIPNLQLPLTLLQKGLYWFHAASIHDPKNMPVFSFDREEGFFYGFPAVNNNIKVARHSGGIKINSPEDAENDKEEYKQILCFIQKHINNINPIPTKIGTCFYTSTPSENFIIDFLPNHSNVMFAAGLSGHGFKMSNMLGCYLATMAITGNNVKEIDFLSLKNILQR